MGVLSIIRQARKAGIKLEIRNNRLFARGPASAEHVVKQLAEHKPAVMIALSEAKRCKYRCDPHHWIADIENGLPDRDRIVCGRCWRFIGYRPKPPSEEHSESPGARTFVNTSTAARTDTAKAQNASLTLDQH